MKNYVRFIFSVGDTTWAVYNHNWARQLELVTLNTRFGVDDVTKRVWMNNVDEWEIPSMNENEEEEFFILGSFDIFPKFHAPPLLQSPHRWPIPQKQNTQAMAEQAGTSGTPDVSFPAPAPAPAPTPTAMTSITSTSSRVQIYPAKSEFVSPFLRGAFFLAILATYLHFTCSFPSFYFILGYPSYRGVPRLLWDYWAELQSWADYTSFTS